MASKSNSLHELIEHFNDDFSNQRLDAVMKYFAPHAEFRNLDGSVAKGVIEIRKAFQRLFDGAYGKVTFVEKNLIIDEAKKEASFVWNCEHYFGGAKPEGLVNGMIFSTMKTVYGRQSYWEGVDYFIFDENNKIVSKQTYGKASYPKLIRL